MDRKPHTAGRPSGGRAAGWRSTGHARGQKPRAAGELERQPLIGVVEIDIEQLGDPAQPVRNGVAVQVQPLRRLDDRPLLVEVGRERLDRGLGPARAELLQRRQLVAHRGPGGVGRVPLHEHPLHPHRVMGGDARRLARGAGGEQLAPCFGGRGTEPHGAFVRRSDPGPEPQPSHPAADGLQRTLGRPGGPGTRLRAGIGTRHPDKHDRPRDPRQIPGAAGRRDGLQRELARRFQQLEPLDLVRLGLLQIVRLDPDRDMPAADRDTKLPGTVEQVLVDRRLRHEQLGQQLAPGTGRQFTGPPCQVEEPGSGECRIVQDQPGADTGVAEYMRSDEKPDRRLPDHDGCAHLVCVPAVCLARTPATCRARSIAGDLVDGGTAIALSQGTELDRGPEGLADHVTQFVQVGAVLLGAEHGIQPLLRPAQRTLGTAADLPHERLHQLGQVGIQRDGDECDVGAPGDVGHRHGRPPPLGREGRDGGHLVNGCPAQRHIQAVVGDLRRGGPGKNDHARMRGMVQLRESLREPDHGDLAITAAPADPAQPSKRRAREDLINGRHQEPHPIQGVRRPPYAERTVQSPSRCNLPINPRLACWEYVVESRLSSRCG